MIAARLGRAPSTVSRELRRNVRPHNRGIYDGDLAHARARERARRPRRGRLIEDPQLRAAIQAKLELEWSPEQIAAHLRAAYPASPRWHVCHETIYQVGQLERAPRRPYGPPAEIPCCSPSRRGGDCDQPVGVPAQGRGQFGACCLGGPVREGCRHSRPCRRRC